MIQIRISTNELYSLPEMAQMAIEGGCQWIVIDPAGLGEAALRNDGTQIATLCRETGVMLTIEGHIEAARELGLHGVYMAVANDAIQAREALGAEAVIGSEAASAEAASALGAADIDYVVLPFHGEDAAACIAMARQQGCTIPFVAKITGLELRPDTLKALLDTGFNGFWLIDGLFDHSDPAARMEEILLMLSDN